MLNDVSVRIWALTFFVAAIFAAREVASYAAEATAGLEVHDVSLWIIDPGSQTANSRSVFPSGLPATVLSTRNAADSLAARRLAPVNVLTFHGPESGNLDVELRANGGSFVAHWPPGESLPNRLRWSGMPSYELADKVDAASELMFVEADDWFAKARGVDALYVRRGARAERFLAYDVELKLEAPLRLEGGPDKFTVLNNTDRPLYDVLIVLTTPEGCRVAWLDVLEKGAAAPAPAPGGEPKVKPPVNALSLVVDQQPQRVKAALAIEQERQARAEARAAALLVEVRAKGEQAAVAAAQEAAGAAEAPAAESKKPAGGLFGSKVPVPKKAPEGQKQGPGLFGGIRRSDGKPPAGGAHVELSSPLAPGSPEAAAKTKDELRNRLTKAGLTAGEAELFVDHYGPLLFEDKTLVVACRLDPAAIDEKVPLSVFPAPAKTVRVAMAIVRNLDPQVGSEVERLIAQLGDPKFSVREAAQQRLLELGPLAFPALNGVLNHADPEIVIRAERILLKQKQTPGSTAPAAGVRVGPNGVLIQAAPVIINR